MSNNVAIDAYFSGLVGGFAGAYVGQPFDIIKTRLQVANETYQGSIRKCFTSILRNEGALGFWAGVTAPLTGMMLINGIIFGVEEMVMSRMTPTTNRIDLVKQHCVAGAIAGAAQTGVASPTELIKCRMQIQKMKGDASQEYKHVFDGAIRIARSEGVMALMDGFMATLLREVPSFSVYFGTYYWIETHPQFGFKTPSSIDQMMSVDMLKLMFAGGIAGQVCWLASYPMDVLKSRIQIDGFSDKRKYTGLVDCLRKSVKAEGFGWCFKGLAPCLIRAFPTNACTFSVTLCMMELLSKVH